MPPRTGPRRRRRIKQAPPAPQRRFALIRADDTADLLGSPEVVHSHRIALSDGHLMLHDEDDAIIRIIAKGQWREIRPASMAEMADMTLPKIIRDAPPIEPGENREQATLVNENDPVFQPTRKEEEDRRFVPASPEEAQRVLMELHRRLAPDYQDPPEEAPQPLPPAGKSP